MCCARGVDCSGVRVLLVISHTHMHAGRLHVLEYVNCDRCGNVHTARCMRHSSHGMRHGRAAISRMIACRLGSRF